MTSDQRQAREKEFWDKAYSVEMYSTWREQSYESWKAYRQLQSVALDFLGSVGNKRLRLCGVGSEAVSFARAGAIVYGFDISETQIMAVELLARRYGLKDAIKISPMPFERLDYPDSFFDLAYGHAILHHIDLKRGASELNRVLRPGGRGSFIEPLGMNPILEFARRHLPYREKHRTADEKPLTYADLSIFTQAFARSQYQGFSFLAMLRRRIITNKRVTQRLERMDQIILKIVPRLRRFCAEVWIGVEKISA